MSKIILVIFIALGKPQAVISEEAAKDMEAEQNYSKEEHRISIGQLKSNSSPRSLSAADGNNTSKKLCSISLPIFLLEFVTFVIPSDSLYNVEYNLQEKWLSTG